MNMKKNKHPESRLVVFRDISTGDLFLADSTVNTKAKITYLDNKEYPLFEVEISSASHPFYTGKQKFIDAADRVKRFRHKYNV